MLSLLVPRPPTYFSDGLLTSPSAKPVTDTGMPYATQCDTPWPPRPSGSNMSSARLVAFAGTLFHASGGETFSPTQFGFFGLFPAFFCASQPPSWKAEELIVKSC